MSSAEAPQVIHPSLESSFGHLLAQALCEWVDIGRHSGRRLDDLLFNEWNPALDGEFSGWVMSHEYADWQADGPMFGKPFPPHRNIMWPLLLIQAAIFSRNPNLIVAILEHEVEYELNAIAENEWQDEQGNLVELPDDAIRADQRTVMGWPSEWLRVFGEIPDQSV